MPIIELPKIGPVQFSDELNGDQLQAQMQSLADKYDFKLPGPDLTFGEKVGRGFQRGLGELGNLAVNQIPALAESAVSAGAQSLGLTGLAASAQDIAQRKLQQSQQKSQDLRQEYAPQYQSLDDVENPLQFGGWAVENLAEQIPNLATMLIPGIGSSAVAGRVALTNAAKGLAVQAVKAGLEGEAKDQFIQQGLQQLAPRIAASKANAQNLGMYLGAYAQSAPQTFQSIYNNTGEIAPGASALFGAGVAALNTILPAKLANSLSSEAKTSIVANMLTKSGMEPTLAKTILADTLTSAGIQGGVGGGSEALNIAAEKLVSDNPQIFDSDDWKRVMHGAVAGAVVGAPFGVFTGAMSGLRGKGAKTVPTPEETATGVVGPENGLMPGVDPTAPPPRTPPTQAEVQQANVDRLNARRETVMAAQSQDALKTQMAAVDIPSDLISPALKKASVETPPVETTPTGRFGEADFKAMGVNRGNSELRAALLNKDITDPIQRAEVKKTLEWYAGQEGRTPALRDKVRDYVNGDRFKESSQEQIAKQQADADGATPTKPAVPRRSLDADEAKMVEANKAKTNAAQTAEIADRMQNPDDIRNLKDYVNNPLYKERLAENPREAINEPDGLYPARPGERANVVDEAGQPRARTDKGVDRNGDAVPGRHADDITKSAAEQPASLEEAPIVKKPGFETSGRPELLLNKIAKDPSATKESISRVAQNLEQARHLRETDANTIKSMSEQPEVSRQALFDYLQQSIHDYKTLKGPQTAGKPLSEEGKAFVSNNDTKGLVSHLANNAKDPNVKQILNKFKKVGANPKIEIGEISGEHSGYYDPSTNTIRLDPNRGLNEHTIVHEMTHAAISKVLDNQSHPLTIDFNSFFNQIKGFVGDSYGGKNLQEFAAELTSNPEFQSLLKTIKAPKSGSLFQKIMRSIAEFFGFKKGTSAYEQGLKFVNDAVDISGDAPALPSDKMYLGTADAFPDVRNLGAAMPEFSKKQADNALNMLSKATDTARRWGMGVFRLDHFHTMFGKELPAIKTIMDAVELKAGYRQKENGRVSENLNRFAKAERQHPEAVKKMAEMAIDARLARLDILDPKFEIKDPNNSEAGLKAKQDEYARLTKVYKELPDSVKDIYKTMREDYQASLDSYMQYLLGDKVTGEGGLVEASLSKKLRAEFEGTQQIPGYVPFKRYGDYKVEYEDPKTGDRAVSAFETRRERDQFISKNLKNKYNRPYEDLGKQEYDKNKMPPNSFVTKILEGLREKGVEKEALDDVYQAYLELFPAQSIAKQFMHSKDVAGMSKDVIRDYASTMQGWINKLARSKYDTDLDRGFSDLKTQAENSDNQLVKEAASNLMGRSKFLHNPEYGTVASVAAQTSYFVNIAGNVSSAFVNLSTIPTLLMPHLAGRHGFAPAMKELGAALKLAVNKDWQSMPKYKELYETLLAHDQINHTTMRDIHSTAKGGVLRPGSPEKVWGTFVDLISKPFSETEKYNRVATAISAYELAKKGDIFGKKMNHQEALAHALQTVKDLNTSGLRESSAGWMQNDLGRTILTFKGYVWNATFVLARAFHQAVKGESPEMQRIARRQLLGILGMAVSFGGLKGLPLFGAAGTAAQMLNYLFGDDDTYNFGESMRQHFGDLFYKGPINYLTNLDIAQRGSIGGDLLWKDDPRSVAQDGYVWTALKQGFGPSAQFAGNFEKGLDAWFNQGNAQRGIEQMVPAFVRNGMKGYRFATEGARTAKGDPIAEDVSAYNAVMQGFGFAPADIGQFQETKAVVSNAQNNINSRKKLISGRYELAKRSGDSSLMQEVAQEIKDFNKKYPTLKISPASIDKSIQSHNNKQKQMLYGLNLPPKLAAVLKKEFPED